MAELRAAWAIALKDLRVLGRYPLQLTGVVWLPLYQFLLPSILLGSTFLVGERAVGLQSVTGTADMAGFLFVGALAASFVFGAFWGIAFPFKLEMDSGTLESGWLTPTRPETFVLGHTIASYLVSTAGGLLLLAVGAVLFGARYVAASAAAAPALVLSLVSLIGIAYLISAAVLLIKEANFFVDTTSFLFSVGSGVLFPIAVLPTALKVVALALPVTYALDLLRAGALGTHPLLPPLWEYLALAALAGISLPFGLWVFRRTEHRLRVRGTLGQH